MTRGPLGGHEATLSGPEVRIALSPEATRMKIDELPGQWVWLNAGTPVLYRSRDTAPAEIAEHRVVKVERIVSPAGTVPALAVWSDDEGEHGVEARRLTSQVMSLPPSGDSPVSTVAEAIASRLGHPHGR